MQSFTIARCTNLVNSVVLIHIGKVEVGRLWKQDAIAQGYILKYDSRHSQSGSLFLVLQNLSGTPNRSH
ncbi:MAG: hypothetical protein KME25_11515 [Symplocastrum torsivum CPER-KK1]|uniref:Uncharacterized protein n=1 Tax=Symplocastrum torsivum CPER-KK1 TaxID=450513 RepID=A0A951PJW1_9CYAN|nr:hypothetical protein [Symplocastrum torsivum CPER-KK1]